MASLASVLRVPARPLPGSKAGALCFGAGAHGKPELIDARRHAARPSTCRTRRRTALYAFATAHAVGVDVEAPTPPVRRPRHRRARARRRGGARGCGRWTGRARTRVPALLGSPRGAAEVPGHRHRRASRARGAAAGRGSRELDLGAGARPRSRPRGRRVELRCWRWPERPADGGRAGSAQRIFTLTVWVERLAGDHRRRASWSRRGACGSASSRRGLTRIGRWLVLSPGQRKARVADALSLAGERQRRRAPAFAASSRQ